MHEYKKLRQARASTNLLAGFAQPLGVAHFPSSRLHIALECPLALSLVEARKDDFKISDSKGDHGNTVYQLLSGEDFDG